jgi:hypothetical protein
MATLAPARMKLIAAAKPMPWLPPVISAERPSILISIIC